MDVLEWVGAFVGLIYIWLEYKANIWLWLAGIIMPAIYIFVYLDAGFYADFGINVYYLIAGIYGWIVWMRGSIKRRRAVSARVDKKEADYAASRMLQPEVSAGTNGPGTTGRRIKEGHDPLCARASCVGSGSNDAVVCEERGAGHADGPDGDKPGILPITRMPRKFYIPSALSGAVFFVAIAAILIFYTDSTVPYGDSVTTALSVVGLWMLARKYVEQWIVWIVVDVICCGLYFYKALYPTAVLYGLYAVIAVFGYFKWLRMMKEQNDQATASGAAVR